uniref:Uncharacterized protein n=1 Tax=Amphimedon queenslandica TaxID=400682 RepID=A0A1X7UKQ3_AMPQE
MNIKESPLPYKEVLYYSIQINSYCECVLRSTINSSYTASLSQQLMMAGQPLLYNNGHHQYPHYNGVQYPPPPAGGQYGGVYHPVPVHPPHQPPGPYYDPRYHGYNQGPPPPIPDIYRPVLPDGDDDNETDDAQRPIVNLPAAVTCPRGAVPLPKQEKVSTYICASTTCCIISILLLMVPVIPFTFCALICSIAAIKQENKMKYVSAHKKGSCALGCMIVAVPVGIGWAVVTVVPFDQEGEQQEEQQEETALVSQPTEVQETSFQPSPYPALVDELRSSSRSRYRTFSSSSRYRSIPPQRKGSAWSLCLIVSVIFGIICLIPAPICSAASLVFAVQAVEAEKQHNFRRRYTKEKWSLSCCLLSVILGTLCLAVVSLIFAAVETNKFISNTDS